MKESIVESMCFQSVLGESRSEVLLDRFQLAITTGLRERVRDLGIA